MKFDRVILYRMAIAVGVALLGTLGTYATIVEPDTAPTPHGISMITAAVADRAGATVSFTQ
jgi:NADPH:quinone reductase-like Zn-dependent oxidoreductase